MLLQAYFAGLISATIHRVRVHHGMPFGEYLTGKLDTRYVLRLMKIDPKGCRAFKNSHARKVASGSVSNYEFAAMMAYHDGMPFGEYLTGKLDTRYVPRFMKIDPKGCRTFKNSHARIVASGSVPNYGLLL